MRSDVRLRAFAAGLLLTALLLPGSRARAQGEAATPPALAATGQVRPGAAQSPR